MFISQTAKKLDLVLFYFYFLLYNNYNPANPATNCNPEDMCVCVCISFPLMAVSFKKKNYSMDYRLQHGAKNNKIFIGKMRRLNLTRE